MGLCGEGKKKRQGKVIIIPKGMVNPNDQTIIEIPNHLDTNSSLVVKAPADNSSCLTVEAYNRNTEQGKQLQLAPALAAPPQRAPQQQQQTPMQPQIFTFPPDTPRLSYSAPPTTLFPMVQPDTTLSPAGASTPNDAVYPQYSSEEPSKPDDVVMMKSQETSKLADPPKSFKATATETEESPSSDGCPKRTITLQCPGASSSTGACPKRVISVQCDAPPCAAHTTSSVCTQTKTDYPCQKTVPDCALDRGSHSPICPICRRVPSLTCPYFKSYCSPNQSLLNPSRPSRIPCLENILSPSKCPLDNICAELYRNNCRSPSPSSPVRACKSEKGLCEPPPSRCPSDRKVLDSMLEDKINKILKPVLMSFIKNYGYDDEREIELRSNCSSASDRRRKNVDVRDSSSFGFNRRSCWKDDDYDDYVSCYRPSRRYKEEERRRPCWKDDEEYDSCYKSRRREDEGGSRRPCWKDNDDEYESYYKSKTNKDKDDDECIARQKANTCTSNYGCPYRKQNVNFESYSKNDLEYSPSEKSLELPKRDSNFMDIYKRGSR